MKANTNHSPSLNGEMASPSIFFQIGPGARLLSGSSLPDICSGTADIASY